MARAPKLMTDTPAAEDGVRMRASPTGPEILDLLTGLSSRLSMLEKVRLSWWTHWKELAAFILPRRYVWLATPDKNDRGSPLNNRIINSTGTEAARKCASGIMSGVSSPSRPWFRLTVPDPELAQDQDVQTWCDEVTKRMMRVMAGSGYYNAKATQYLDLVVFGTAPMIIYEDEDTVIRCFVPAAGEYFCATGPNFSVNTLFRKFTMTVAQVVAEFGIENCSTTLKSLYGNGRAMAMGSMDQEIVVCHAIEPNPDYERNPRSVGRAGLPRNFRYREVYWEEAATERALRISGFLDQPFSCPRWDTLANDAYGRSPAMDALGDIKQLQQEEKRKAQGIDKMTDPPMVADASMKNEPASLLPGAITYVPRLDAGIGFKPAFMVNLPLGELKEDIAKVESRIREVFFNDVFLMISQLDTVRTATEIDARREEKLIMLGPVLDRNQQEGLTPDINRIFQIMARRGLLPPPPDVMRNTPVKVDYISPLADLQRASAATGIERLWGFTGTVSAARPEALDNLDADASIAEMAELLRVPPKLLTGRKQKEAIRAARNAQVQQQTQVQLGAEAVNAGKVLSDTDVGGGQNALNMILNGG